MPPKTLTIKLSSKLIPFTFDMWIPIFPIFFFIFGSVSWLLDHSYNPSVDFALGFILLGLKLSYKEP